MAAMYPSLHERFKDEGICPICLMEMERSRRYSCVNGHTVCFRCKPYYYACPSCWSPLNVEIQAARPSDPPPPTHFMPHPMPDGFQPSAPSVEEFLSHERHNWCPPEPPSDQELASCSYSNLGCWVKVPKHLQDMHESRCQFRPHWEEERLPTDIRHDQGDLVECTYRSVGCKVRMPAWRQTIHEGHCNYKERYESLSQLDASFVDLSVEDDGEEEDPEELVGCRFRSYGCMVQMPRRRKYVHEEKCNYRTHGDGEEDVIVIDLLNEEADPEEQVDCRWAENGCRVRPKRSRQEIHEGKCNYRMEECAYKDNGCDAMFEPARRFAHERSCEYAY